MSSHIEFLELLNVGVVDSDPGPGADAGANTVTDAGTDTVIDAGADTVTDAGADTIKDGDTGDIVDGGIVLWMLSWVIASIELDVQLQIVSCLYRYTT